MFRILLRYVASAAGVALLLVGLNLVFFVIWVVQAGRATQIEYRITDIADGLVKHNGEYVLSDLGQEAIGRRYAWAMLLDERGDVIWSLKLPKEIKSHYSVPEVASFTHWYLEDYPVYVWRHSDGLLVLGSPKGSAWKIGVELPQIVMAHAVEWLLALVGVNALAAVLLALLLGLRLFGSLRVLAKGIEGLSEQKSLALPTGGILGDLAEKLNQASQELKRQEAALQKRDNARLMWIAGVSHDIRTPLSMVMGHASQLEENGQLSQGEREQARIIRQQSEKIKKLVNDLNLASKLEYDMQPFEMGKICGAELARSVTADFYNNGLEEPYSIELDIAAEAGRSAFVGDEALMRRALANLINNCIQHNPDGCRVRVVVEQTQEACVVCVADNGAGFPEEVLQALKSGQNPAHGLGLTLVRHIVKAHGGTAHFDNLETGCQVSLQLPLAWEG
jgi:signal transduction histidine kinase